jgi:hypothetical protein
MSSAPDVEIRKAFEYENGFYLTADVSRFAKFAAHLDLFRRTASAPGTIVECGVFKGASLMRWIKFRALLENTWSRKIVAFDVFGEFPEASYEPDRAVRQRFVESAGQTSIGQERLAALLAEHGLRDNVDLVAGDILTTVPEYLAANPALKISLLHVDVDLYQPTYTCLEHLYPRLVRGGIAILDDYGAFPGANKAIDEFFADRGAVISRLSYSANLAYVERP